MEWPPIAIVGMACRYPDADSPEALWENVLAQRRAFRRIPTERLNLDDYWSADHDAPDRTYAAQAAVLEGYTFDRVRYRVSGSTFRAVDMAHWLALDVASDALIDAGFPDGTGLPREATGVLLGNTLTGEFSRANLMRLRWPYVRRVLDAALAEDGWTPAQRRVFIERLEARYKAPFPPVGTETLAGGLSNTIAGRICNHFDLNGGGYAVDGACAASLLAVINACTAIATGDLDVALAGGVDLSLDPFELVGFAKVGALASEQMRVYDARSDGFWPGEGCGFVVLMPYKEALRQGRRVYAIIRGWGVSSDGCGGITRPEVDGQLLAVRRAYRRAAFGPETVALFEGHGTGTAVGDTTELRMLTRVRRDADPAAAAAAIGSVKANIGHTKAAAGMAGILKATMALHHQIIPPTTGCETPHPELTGEAPALQVLQEGEVWPADLPLRAGVSAMGFGGINTHVVLEGVAQERVGTLIPHAQALLTSAQDAELFFLGADDALGLRRQVDHLLTFTPKLSQAELADVAAQLAATLEARTVRAAVVASSPSELTARLQTLAAWLTAKAITKKAITKMEDGVYLGLTGEAPRIGFLFPGQGSPASLDGGLLRRRFAAARAFYDEAGLPNEGDTVATEVAQPAIVTAQVAVLRVLSRLGVTASIAVGHSLGELTALHWAGAFDEQTLLRLTTARGQAMGDLDTAKGTMAGIAAGPGEVKALLEGVDVVIAGLNGPQQTVVSGEEETVATVVTRARARGLQAQQLPVSRAFHSTLVAAAAKPLARYLAGCTIRPLRHPVVSTVTGALLDPDDDVRPLLVRQVTAPVRFTEALSKATRDVDLWIEVGPGQVLSRLARRFIETPIVATDAGGPSLSGMVQAVGAAFALGAPVHPFALFKGRFTRSFSLDWQPHFFVNPCEQAPASDPDLQLVGVDVELEKHHSNGKASDQRATVEETQSANGSPLATLELVRQLVAERAELPLSAVRDGDRLLSDLHLNSITVGELLVEATRRIGLSPSAVPTDYADATLARMAEALEERICIEGPASGPEAASPPNGVDTWIMPFTVALIERVRPRRQHAGPAGTWRLLAPSDYPLKTPLQKAFDHAGWGGGVVVALPPDPGEVHVRFLFEGACAVMAEGTPRCFVLVQHGGGAAALARTLYQEAPGVTVCVVDVPVDHPEAVDWVLAEAKAAAGYTEAHYDTTGVRREPRLRLLPLEEEHGESPLSSDDVLLVTGGGKGVTAECVFAIGCQTGAHLVLMGRSRPDADAEVAATLERMAAVGLRVYYARADVTDAEAVRVAVKEAEARFGPITGIVHGAARNVPQRLSALDEASVRKTLAPKVQGLRNILTAIDPERLHLLVTFGSIIARMGLPGEAHYALANEWLVRETEHWQQAHPSCRCLAIEWSVWSGVGMGVRLGSVDALLHRGVTPIPPETGISMLKRLLAHPPSETAVVVTGCFGDPPTLQIEQPALPLLRFLEQPGRYVPGVELIVEARLSPDTDPYLDDHRLQGERILPAVIGLEAMAQTAMALTGSSRAPVFEGVSFNRPVVIPEGVSSSIRVVALVRAAGRVEVALRSEQTAFQTDHFRAVCCFDALVEEPRERFRLSLEAANGHGLVALDPEQDLYGGILFHQGRFRRLRGYRMLKAKACVAEIMPDTNTAWFSGYLPAGLVLGDPGARDAAIHAIQACIPHSTLIPIGVDRLLPGVGVASGMRLVQAQERDCHGDTFVYDVIVSDAEGRVVEQWEGLRLQRVGHRFDVATLAAPLLGPYLERRVHTLMPDREVTVVMRQDEALNRQARSDRAMQQALGAELAIRRRPNGKPEAANGSHVSVAHAGALVLAIAGTEPVGCDLEHVTAHPETLWHDLIGPKRHALAALIAQETGEDFDAAATRLWTALESLKKAGAAATTPLVLEAAYEDGWVVLASGPFMVATLVTCLRHADGRLGLALLTSHRSCKVPTADTLTNIVT